MRWNIGVPPWHAHAKCAHTGAPWWWDDPVEGKITDAERVVRAVALCQDCPVAALCAAEALAQKDAGVTRGGVPLTQQSMNRPKSRRLHHAALRRVQAGMTPARAALDVYGKTPQYKDAVIPLQAILHGKTPLPGTDTPPWQTVPFTAPLTRRAQVVRYG